MWDNTSSHRGNSSDLRKEPEDMRVDHGVQRQLSWSRLASTPLIDDTVKNLMTIRGVASARNTSQRGRMENPLPSCAAPRRAIKQQEGLIPSKQPRQRPASPVLSLFGSCPANNDNCEDQSAIVSSVYAEAPQSDGKSCLESLSQNSGRVSRYA